METKPEDTTLMQLPLKFAIFSTYFSPSVEDCGPTPAIGLFRLSYGTPNNSDEPNRSEKLLLSSGIIRITTFITCEHDFLLCILPFLVRLFIQIDDIEFAWKILLHMTIALAFIILSVWVGPRYAFGMPISPVILFFIGNTGAGLVLRLHWVGPSGLVLIV